MQFLGYLPPEALEEKLMDAAAVVMPSLAGEVFGLVGSGEHVARQIGGGF